ncbi:MAG: TIGR01777 family protein [Anaerolineaceae bacterium]|nr:TIGR01777 family protein [Anaerolineaceae bacterium]
MYVLIAGGSGYIGKALTKQLTEQGYQVTILSRNPQRVKPGSNTRVLGWDGAGTQGWGHLVDEMDAIVNLSGENLAGGRWSPVRLQKIRASRVEPGRAIVEAVRQASRKPAVIFQASAVGYYGKLDERVVTEESPPGSATLAQLVVDWENAIRPAEDLGVRVVIGRAGLVLSRESRALKPLILQYRLFAGGALGDGKQWWSWITLQDEVRAIQYLLENEKALGAYNLTAPSPLTMADFGRVLASELKRPYWLMTPAWVLRTVFGKMSTVLLDGQRAIPRRLLNLGFKFQYPGLSAALKMIL